MQRFLYCLFPSDTVCHTSSLIKFHLNQYKRQSSKKHRCYALFYCVTGKATLTGTWLGCGAGEPLFMGCWETAAGSILLICVMKRKRSFKAGLKLQMIFSTYKIKEIDHSNALCKQNTVTHFSTVWRKWQYKTMSRQIYGKYHINKSLNLYSEPLLKPP